MDKLGFLLSKKILVVLSGIIFSGVAFASSGAESLLQNTTAASETKVPEVQAVADDQQTPQKSSPVPSPKQATRPAVTANLPTANATPKPSATSSFSQPTPAPKLSTGAAAVIGPSSSPSTITGLRQSSPVNSSDDDETEEADDSDETEINKAFQKAEEED